MKLIKSMGKKKSKKQIKRWALIAVSVAVLLALCAIVVVRRAYLEGIKPVSSSQKSVTIVIPLDSSLRKVGTILYQNKLIKSQWAFERFVRNRGLSESVQAGTYDLRPSESTAEIVSILTQGKVSTNLVTILPAQRLDEIRSALINYGFTPADVDSALVPSLYAGHPALVDKPKDASLEGYLYPESFQKTSQTKATDIVKQSLDEMYKHLTPDIRAGFVRQGFNIHQGITLASIVAQESGKPADQPGIAQVFLLRLKQGIPLQSNVTANYAADIADKPRNVGIDSPYNTYLHTGLTPGPIGNVTAGALDAVAHPAATDYLYFLAGDGADEGKIYFSHTSDEHQQLIRDHCHTLCAQP